MRIGAIIQARYDSTRFPGKVLMNLPFNENRTVVGHIVKRLKKLDLLHDIIIATSKESNDDIIANFASNEKINCVRGDKKNVLSRFVKAIDKNKLDIVIRITADNPIVLIDIIEDSIKKHIESKADYTRNLDLPHGTSFEIVNSDILKRISLKDDLVEFDKEHVTTYIKNNRENFYILELHHGTKKTNFRFTIDYPSDYAAMNIIFQYLSSLDYNYDMMTLINFINTNNWIQNVNKSNYQKKQYNKFNKELKGAIELLSSLEFSRVVSLLKKIKQEK